VLAATAEINVSDAGFLDSLDGTLRTLGTTTRVWRAGIALTEVRERDAALGGFLFTAAELPATEATSPGQPGVQIIATESAGPRLQLAVPRVAPKAGQPFAFEVGFTAGAAAVDPRTLRVELELPTGWRNLTDRFRALAQVTPQAARAPQLRLPAGTHVLRVSVQDIAGREAISHIRLVVER
jgi:hypothetical protein